MYTGSPLYGSDIVTPSHPAHGQRRRMTDHTTPEEVAEACPLWSRLGGELVACELYPDGAFLISITLVFEQRVCSNNRTNALTGEVRGLPTFAATPAPWGLGHRRAPHSSAFTTPNAGRGITRTCWLVHDLREPWVAKPRPPRQAGLTLPPALPARGGMISIIRSRPWARCCRVRGHSRSG